MVHDELYIPVSEIARVRHGGAWYTNVEVDWLRLGRAAPIAPYAELITDYARLSAAERAAAEQYIDELFTGAEYDLLRAHLARRGLVVGLSVVPIPIEVKPAAVGFIAMPMQTMIAIDESGVFGWHELEIEAAALPFRVVGTYCVRGANVDTAVE